MEILKPWEKRIFAAVYWLTVLIVMPWLIVYSANYRVAHGADLQSVSRQCAQEIDQQAGCTTACVNTMFPEWVRCTNARISPHYPQSRVEMCIKRTQAQRAASHACELCGDPVAEVFVCARD